MKECIKCNVNKPDSAFYRKPSDGRLLSQCRNCQSAYKAAYDKKHKEVKKAYAVKYFSENRERVLKSSRIYKANNPEKLKESRRRYRTQNRETLALKNKAYRDAHKETINARVRDHYKNNREQQLLVKKAYKKANPDKVKFHKTNRLAAKRQRSPVKCNELDLFVFSEAASLVVVREKATGTKWHIDHIEPLQGTTVSGLHNVFNVAVVPATYNLHKSNKQVPSPWHWVNTK